MKQYRFYCLFIVFNVINTLYDISYIPYKYLNISDVTYQISDFTSESFSIFYHLSFHFIFRMYSIPTIGLGTWKSPKTDELINAIVYSVKEAGIVHIDCASISIKTKKSLERHCKSYLQWESKESNYGSHLSSGIRTTPKLRQHVAGH